MALDAGNQSADSGMSMAIYNALYDNLKSNFPDEQPPDDVCDSWKKLAYSISIGVIEHIKANMEITGITTKGDVTIDVSGNSGVDIIGGHFHPVNISSTKSDIVFTQSNDGTGRVQ